MFDKNIKQNHDPVLFDPERPKYIIRYLTKNYIPDYQETKINMRTDKIAININHKLEKQRAVENYRFRIVLHFFLENTDASVGQIRIQLRSLNSDSDEKHRVTVVNFEEQGSISSCSIKSSEVTELKKLSDGDATLILSSDNSGNLGLKLEVNQIERSEDDVSTTVRMIREIEESCEAGFLRRANKVVFQWVDLGDHSRTDADDIFTVSYQLFHPYSKLLNIRTDINKV